MSELTANKLPEGQSCGTCRFAGTHVEAGTGKDRTLVRCLRFPPQRLGQVPRYSPNGPISQAKEDTGWPVTTWDDWCGEWRSRLVEVVINAPWSTDVPAAPVTLPEALR